MVSAMPPRASPPGTRTRRAGKQRLEQKDATRVRIFEAARKLFIENVFRETRSTEIAAAAGVSTGSVFAHFGSKAKIMALMQRDFMASYLDRIRSARFTSRDAVSRIKELVEFLWATHEQPTEGMDFMRTSMSYTWMWDEEDEAAYQEYLADRRAALRKIFEDCDDWHEFKRCEDIDFALRLFQAFHGDVIRESAFRSAEECRARLELALFMLLRGGASLAVR
jgi:AcrR family transcriptional regulator